MISFREMEEKDAPKIEQLEKRMFTDAWSSHGIIETWNQPHTTILLAEDHIEIVGYCILYYLVDESELVRIAVREDYQCQGVGSKLLKEAFQYSKQRKMKKILLEVRENNENAIRFYLAHGFVKDALRKDFYDMPKENAILMSRVFGV